MNYQDLDPDKIISDMSLQEKLGQLIMVGFNGQRLTAELKEMISKYNVGGIIYFARNIENPEQIFKLSSEIQRLSMESNSIPALISADEEGGVVTRVNGMTHMPGLMAVGATGNYQEAYKAAKATAEQLKYLGINMNLAPVLDINNNPKNPVIGVRSFGSDPLEVSRFGKEYINGLQEAGVVACGKHFPGHGDTSVDSHHDLPVIEYGPDRLNKVELKPFREAIKAGIDSIMTAHIAFPELTSEAGLPATLSEEILTGILREKLGFEGMIITDCMEMNGIVGTYGTVPAGVMTIQAGSDQVLVSHNRRKQLAVLEELERAVNDGRLSETRIDESVKRVLRLKQQRLSWGEQQKFSDSQFSKLLEEGNTIAREISSEAITVLQDQENIFEKPLDKNNEIWLINCSGDISSPVETSPGQTDQGLKSQLAWELSKAGYTVKEFTGLTNEFFKDKIYEKRDLELVVITRDIVKNKDQYKLIQSLMAAGIKPIIISQRNPYELKFLDDLPVLTTYDYSPNHARPLAEILGGKRQAKGKLPVEILEV
ncbi:MAG: beta-N-acetylhexosaminidase [Bacillota bacterium]